MRGIWPIVAVLTGAILLISCARNGNPLAPEPTKPIAIDQFFTGRWFEIARTPMELTDGCVAGTTDYFRRQDGQLMDRDACRQGTPTGKDKTYQGAVTILNPGTNNKIAVSYIVWGFIPVPRTYWILDHANDDSWFIVSDPDFRNVSIFTRSPRPDPLQVRDLVGQVEKLGYDTSKLEFPTQFPSN